MDKYTLEALNRIVDAGYDAAHDDYYGGQSKRTDDENRSHIFNDFKLAAAWIDKKISGSAE